MSGLLETGRILFKNVSFYFVRSDKSPEKKEICMQSSELIEYNISSIQIFNNGYNNSSIQLRKGKLIERQQIPLYTT